MGILDESTSFTWSDLDATYARKPSNGARAVGQGELVLNVRDFGAKGDGVCDDTAAIQTALDVASTNGCTVLVPGPNRIYRVSRLVLRYRSTLEIKAGVTLRRLAGDTEVGPLVAITRNHARVIGGGLIECLNDCPNGILRIERADGACEWALVDSLHIKGPGKTVPGSTGVVFSGTSTFQNRMNGVTVSDVADGVRMENGANANHCTDLRLYNIGQRAYVLDGTIESTFMGGSVLASRDITVFTLLNRALYNSVLGVSAEPGGAATFWSIAAGCLDNSFIGVVDNTALLGNDAGIRTTAMLRRGTYLGGVCYLDGTRLFAPQLVRKTVSETMRRSTSYRLDKTLRLSAAASATYELEAFVVYASSTTADVKFKLATPTGSTAQWTVNGASRRQSTSTAADAVLFGYLDQTMGQIVGGAGIGTKLVAHVKGLITTAQVGGNLGIAWAQVVAEASDLTVAAGSWMTVRRLA